MSEIKEQIVERLRAAVALGDMTGSRGKRPENIYNLADEAADRIEALEKERDEALDAEDQAKDCFWAVYPTYCKVNGHGISTEAARSQLAARIKVLEEALRKIEGIAEANYGRQNEKLADISPIARTALNATPQDGKGGEE